jgi:RIO-like serine/threonine protein kinase
MSSIYDWYERGDIKETEILEKDVELITYYYKCKVCLEKMKEEQLSKYKGITASRKGNSNLHKHLKIDCALHQKAKLE